MNDLLFIAIGIIGAIAFVAGTLLTAFAWVFQ
jgi:hypothetical protein